MKIYTEEQVRKAIRVAGQLVWEDEEIFASLPPIELPKYKEIANASNHCKDIQVKAGFLNGALWLKEQILNQKETL